MSRYGVWTFWARLFSMGLVNEGIDMKEGNLEIGIAILLHDD